MGLIVLIIIIAGSYVWWRKKSGNGTRFLINNGNIETDEKEEG